MRKIPPVIKMLLFGVAVSLLTDALIYSYFASEKEKWTPANAKVIALQRFKFEGSSRAGYGLKITTTNPFGSEKRDITGIYGLSSSARHSFSRSTVAGQTIDVWKHSNGQRITIFAPTESPVFSTLQFVLPTVGLISFILSAFIFGERVDKKLLKRAK